MTGHAKQRLNPNRCNQSLGRCTENWHPHVLPPSVPYLYQLYQSLMPSTSFPSAPIRSRSTPLLRSPRHEQSAVATDPSPAESSAPTSRLASDRPECSPTYPPPCSPDESARRRSSARPATAARH